MITMDEAKGLHRKEALKLHKKLKGKIEIKPKIGVSKENLSLLYTPGVAAVAREISGNAKNSFYYTSRGGNVVFVTDGSRTLGVGNTIPEASLPVLEGKAMLAKFFAGVDAYPICLATKEKEEIVKTIKFLSPNFSVFVIEDIASPKCFEIMEELEKTDIVFFSDDMTGVAIVIFSALLNGLKVVGKKMSEVKICIAGAGAAGYGVFKILNYAGVKNIVAFDAKGIIYRGREGDNKYLREIAEFTNEENLSGGKREAIEGCDVFIGLSGVGNLVDSSEIKQMKKKPIIFALSNPVPEIFPEEIEKEFEHYIFSTGLSDFPNEINNLVVFPGILKALLTHRRKINLDLQVKIAKAIAALIKKPNKNCIIPSPFDRRLPKTIVRCMMK